VKRDIRSVKLRQTSVGVFVRLDTGIILIGDAIQANQCLDLHKLRDFMLEVGLWRNEVPEFHTNFIQLHVCE